jgi:GcrA cell cycle regulator
MNGLPWNEERIESLLYLRGKGFSASQIAGVLGVTRNAIIGKLNRMVKSGHDVPPAPESSKPAEPPRRKLQRSSSIFNYGFDKTPAHLKRKPSLPKEIPPFDMPPARATGASGAMFELLPDDCRWPIGDPRTPEFRFCGAAKLKHVQYCAHHQYASTGVYHDES